MKILASSEWDNHSVIPYRGSSSKKFHIFSKYFGRIEDFQFVISVSSPYDDTEYFWAKKDRPGSVIKLINPDGKLQEYFAFDEYDEDIWDSPEDYCNEMIDYACNRIVYYNSEFGLEPHIIHD